MGALAINKQSGGLFAPEPPVGGARKSAKKNIYLHIENAWRIKLLMKIRRFFRFQYLLFAFVFALLIFMPIFGFAALRNPDGNSDGGTGYQGIVTLWNVDTFEGGTYSRELLLGDFARSFESSHKGLYIVVTAFSPEEFRDQIEKGNRPDLISFGTGAGGLVKGDLQKYRGSMNIRDDLAEGGILSGKQYALPWCMGGYALFSTEKLAAGAKAYAGSKYTLPLAALTKNGVADIMAEESFSTNSQYNAYEKFVAKYSSYLLGTQRDIYRLGLKVDQGKISDLKMRVLGNFTDLVQYMGIFEGVSGGRLDACQNFLEYVTSDTCQKKIARLGMFAATDITLYSGGLLSEMESALKNVRVLSAFTSYEALLEYQSQSLLALQGNEEAKKSINSL